MVLQKPGKEKFNEKNPVSFLHIFFASLEATEWPSLNIMICVFLAIVKPELVSFSHCQSASKLSWAVLYTEIPPTFLCVLHYSSTLSLQLLPYLLWKSRTLHPREWGTHPLTGTVDSLWELQGKERERHFAFISSSVEQEPLALLSSFFFTMGKSSTMPIHFFRPNIMIRKLPDVGAQSHFFPFPTTGHCWSFSWWSNIGHDCCTSPLYQPCWLSVWACCWAIHHMQSRESHHEREFPTCNPWGVKKVKRELETALFSEKATNWPAGIIAT